ALPIVVGASLGPAAALFVGSLAKRRAARRVGLVHLLYQVIGALWLSALSLITVNGSPSILYLVHWVTPGVLFHPLPEHAGHHIAMAFTVYNLLNALLCLALTRPVLAIADRVIPRDPVQDDVKPYHLDANLIEVPALAILQASREVRFLAELCRKAI